MERRAREGNSPVREIYKRSVRVFLSSAGNDSPVWIREDYSPKAKYSLWSIVNEYREGKVKRTPMRGVK